MASAKVYTGPWIDHSKSTLLAPTLTVTTSQALILISFLAVFITIIGAHLWGLVRFTLHQFRCSTAPQDAMYHQEQAVLRNSATPAGAVWEFFKVGFAWRKRPGYGFRRVVPLLCLAALQAAFFSLAGVFSSGVLGGSSIVLVKSESCGYVDMPSVEVESKDPIAVARLGAAIMERKIAAEASAAYARACYGNSSADVDCNSFVVSRLPASFELVACPFANSTCLDGALRADSGFIYTDDNLGINSAKHDSLAYRRVTTCAPIRTNGYSTWRTNSEGAEQYLDLLYSSRSTAITKRQTYSNEKDEEVDMDEVDVDDEDAEDIADDVLPVDDTYNEEVTADVADDEILSDESLRAEETPVYDATEIDDALTEEDSQVEDSTVNDDVKEEDLAVEDSTAEDIVSEENLPTEDSTAEDTVNDDDLPVDDSTAETTTADGTTEFTESRPEETEDQTLEDGILDEDAVENEENNTGVAAVTDEHESIGDDSTDENTTPAEETTEFEEATAAPATFQEDEDLVAANSTTNWLDEPLEEDKTFSYTNEDQASSFDETKASSANTVPVTFTYDKNSAAYITTAYPIEYRFSSLGDVASSTFAPISDLSSSDADITLIILTKNAQYAQAVDDILFNATEVATDASGFSTLGYTSADPVAVMACTEQHQLCDPTMPESTGCSALTGWAAVQAAQQYSGARASVANDLAHAVSNSLLSSMLAQLGPSALLASLSISDAESLHSAALPDNQWQLEVEAWTSYNLAHLQRLIASVATGPALSSSAAYITIPSESISVSEETNETATFSVCANQKILDATHHSFPIFHLSITIAIGCLIIILNVFLAPIIGLLQNLTGFGVSRKQAWEGDHLFQLQRVAYEGANLGTWNGSAKGAHVPTTVYSVMPERFGRPGVKGVYEAVDNEGDASGVYDENNMSDDEVDVEKAAYGDGGKGYVEKSRGRKSAESDRTSLAEEDLVPGKSVYRDADSFGRGVDMGVKDEEEQEEDQRKKKW